MNKLINKVDEKKKRNELNDPNNDKNVLTLTRANSKITQLKSMLTMLYIILLCLCVFMRSSVF